MPENGGQDGLDCGETVHRLYHFLDGELTPDRRTAIAHHLDDCSPCLQAYDFEAEVRRLIVDKCKDHVPDHLRERIAAAIEHEHRSNSASASPGEPEPESQPAVAQTRDSGSRS